MHAGSAKEAWLELEDCYWQSNNPKLYKIRYDISNLKQLEDSVNNYYNKIKALWDELDGLLAHTICTCNLCTSGALQNAREEKRRERINQFVMGLDDDFGIIRGQILAKKLTPLLSKVFLFLVTQEENHKKATRGNQIHKANSTTMAVNKKPPTKNQKKTEKKSFKNGKRPNSDLYCDNCKFHGHTRANCYHLIR